MTDTSPDGPSSPCIDVCRLDRGYAYCIGCFRTMDEIKRWSAMTAAEKRAVLDALPARHAWGLGASAKTAAEPGDERS